MLVARYRPTKAGLRKQTFHIWAINAGTVAVLKIWLTQFCLVTWSLQTAKIQAEPLEWFLRKASLCGLGTTRLVHLTGTEISTTWTLKCSDDGLLLLSDLAESCLAPLNCGRKQIQSLNRCFLALYNIGRRTKSRNPVKCWRSMARLLGVWTLGCGMQMATSNMQPRQMELKRIFEIGGKRS
jgi:hypothetical protein